MALETTVYIIPIDNIILYPDMVYPLAIKNVHFKSLILKAQKEKLNLGFFTKHSPIKHFISPYFILFCPESITGAQE